MRRFRLVIYYFYDFYRHVAPLAYLSLAIRTNSYSVLGLKAHITAKFLTTLNKREECEPVGHSSSANDIYTELRTLAIDTRALYRFRAYHSVPYMRQGLLSSTTSSSSRNGSQ